MVQAQQYKFESEAAQILELMTHAVYSNRDTFLRELISNASDAIDRRRFLGLSDHELLEASGDYEIYLEVDRDSRSLTVLDNGIGMSRAEVIDNIGTIARSGTKEFLRALADAKRADAASPELIGQFGVGFYASFMVAERVVIDTLKAGESEATRWESTGDGTYTIAPGERRAAGTAVTLHLKPADPEAGLRDYTSEAVLRDIVKRYSDFVAHPVKMKVERQEPEPDAEGKAVEGGSTQTIVETVTLNSMKAVWSRSESEVTDEEYNELYRHVSHDWQPPMRRIVVKAEGTCEFRGVLFIPKKAPFDLYYQGSHHGLKLYVRRVLIMDACKDLLPSYLRCVRGVVEAEDLPLNLSREMLQENRQIKVIRKHLVKKVLEALAALMKDDRSLYEEFWGELGRAIREGLYQDAAQKEALLELVLAHSTHEPGKLTTLAEYVERKKDGQTEIYYQSGPSLEAVQGSPHIEAFADKGYEVLLFADPVDEIWLHQGGRYRDHGFTSIGKGTVDLGTEQERKEAQEALEEKQSTYKSLLVRLRAELDERVKEVRLSTRMKASASCLVGDTGDLSPQLEQMLKSMGQPIPDQKRILEVNPHHPLLARLHKLLDNDASSATITRYAKLLYGQAVLAEGGQLPDPGEFSRLVAEVMTDALPL